MKVFISHKREDAALAFVVKNAFGNRGVTAYLDILDNCIIGNGKELTEHIKNNLNCCTDIIVVMSENTKISWWVPFEVGMSAQVNMPTASFLNSDVLLPSYLSYWPRLKTISDVDKYIAIRRKTEKIIYENYKHYTLEQRRAVETPTFYEALKRELR